MVDRLRVFTRALLAVLLLGVGGAAAQTGQASRPPDQAGVSQAAPGASTQAVAPPAGPAGPQIDKAEIAARANREVGVNIETTIAGWQRGLERLESDLRGQRLRYSELNGFRDELQRIRSEVEDFSNRLQAPLAAADRKSVV